MSLPFLRNNKRQDAGSVSGNAKDAEHPLLLQLTEELMMALKGNNVAKAAKALKNICQIVDLMPHEEGEHE